MSDCYLCVEISALQEDQEESSVSFQHVKGFYKAWCIRHSTPTGSTKWQTALKRIVMNQSWFVRSKQQRLKIVGDLLLSWDNWLFCYCLNPLLPSLLSPALPRRPYF